MAMGALSTVGIAVLAYTIGILLGLAGAIGKLSGNDTLKKVLGWYTTLVRSLPELLLIIVLYYLVSDLINQTLALASQPPIRINGFLAAVVVLGFVQGAYHTEVIRGAIQAIHVGQVEAAVAYGMSPWLRFRRVILPAMLGSSLLFYIVTNTASWLTLTEPSYAKTAAGWIQALTTGLPGYAPTWTFLLKSLVSDLLFAALFLACIHWGRRPAPVAVVQTAEAVR